ncbi:MAG: hypothetical protein HXY40_19590 [Chloroflexi bacterium]|nr:hypothetical protein [Chloroflexota bacterium]
MFFQPSNPRRALWDTWLFPAQDQFHLFYLQRDQRDIACTVVGHAVSDDLVHWREVKDALAVGKRGAWDDGSLMTGMTLQHTDSRYYLFYGAMDDDGVQRIGTAISDDLIKWHKHANNPLIVPAAPYETNPRAAPNDETAWRDPCIIRDSASGDYLAYFCARVPGGSHSGGGAIAVSRSRDLLHWEVLPPAFVSDNYVCLEVPDVFFLDGRWYMLFSTGHSFGAYYETADPHISNGTFYLVSDNPLSGWHAPADNILVGSRAGRLDAYVGRSMEYNGTRLFYHHMVLGEDNLSWQRRGGYRHLVRGSFGSVKQLGTTSDGHLQARYYDTLSACQRPLFHRAETVTETTFLGAQQDVIAQLTITPQRENAVGGLLLGYGCLPRQGLLITLNAARQRLDVGLVEGEQTLRRAPALQSRSISIKPGAAYHLRVVARAQFLDIYVDDVLLLAFTWGRAPHGQCALFSEGSAIANVKIDALVIAD